MPQKTPGRTLYGFLAGSTLASALYLAVLVLTFHMLVPAKGLLEPVVIPGRETFSVSGWVDHRPQDIRTGFLVASLASLLACAAGSWLGTRIGRSLRPAILFAVLTAAWGLWEAIAHWTFWVPRFWLSGLGAGLSLVSLLAGRWTLGTPARP